VREIVYVHVLHCAFVWFFIINKEKCRRSLEPKAVRGFTPHERRIALTSSSRLRLARTSNSGVALSLEDENSETESGPIALRAFVYTFRFCALLSMLLGTAAQLSRKTLPLAFLIN
jgi:hypothetical protein